MGYAPDGSPPGCSYSWRCWAGERLGTEPAGGGGVTRDRRADVPPLVPPLRGKGDAGLLHRRIGKASGKRVPLDRREEAEASFGRAIKASRRATSTNIWCAITGSPGAAAGPRRYCKAAISCPRRRGVERIAASGRAGQFAVGRHALCWVHAERLVHNLTRSLITATRRTAGPLRPDLPSTHRLHHARSPAPAATWQQA